MIAEYAPGRIRHPPPAHFAHHAQMQRMLLSNGEKEIVHQGTDGLGHPVLATHVLLPGGEGLPDMGWGLAIEQPEDSIFGSARQLAWQAALIVLGVLAVLTLALTLLGYRLMSPLGRLARFAERIGQGDFRQRIEHRSSDEIGQLAGSFNVMADQLEARQSELLAAKNRIQGIVDAVPGILYTAAPDGFGISYVSPAVEALLGYGPDEFLHDPALRSALMPEADRNAALGEIETAKRNNADFIVTYRMRHKDGETVLWFEDRGSWERDAVGRIVALHGVMTDITLRKQREEQLARTTRALDILHNQDTLLTRATSEAELVEGVCANIVDGDVYQFAWIGLRDPERSGQLYIAAYAGADEAFAAQLASARIDVAECSCPACRAVREGQPRIVQDLTEDSCPGAWGGVALAHAYASLVALPLVGEGEVLGSLNIYAREPGVFDDEALKLFEELAGNLAFGITALRTHELHDQARELLAHQAYHDALTGLPNRAMFLRMLQAALAQRDGGVRLAVLFIDLDDFKLVNDTLGHLAGDELLRQVGERISAGIRGSDLVARQGGDEFIVMMTGFASRDASVGDDSGQDPRLFSPGNQAQRLIDRLSLPFVIEGQKTYVGASIGIAIYPHDATEPETLLRYADSAMYRAKEQGKSSYAFYSAELTERQHKRMSVANRLHQALERGEFLLYYQPVVELASGELKGVEALIRWQDAEGRLVQPGDFLPVAEDTGLIIPIGDWVLEEACRQARAWHAEGLEVQVAINLSARQLWHADIADKLLHIISETGICSESLELEITESAVSHDPLHMEAAFMRFHQGGLKIALDDFGTGYSSLSRLKQLPISTLKIDRSFVDGVPDSEDDTAIVAATMQLAHSLGLRSLAEGIETRRQWQWLRERGCQFGQGYYFSRPVPTEEMTAMLRNGKRWVDAEDDGR